MNFAESVRFLHSLGHELKVVKWTLDRIETLLAELGNPQKQGRFIHVAGTNGKGSTCALMASALRASGFRTGLYTSPHLVDPRERIQIDGQLITEDAWCAAFNQVHTAVELLLAQEKIDAHPSFFETMTAMAFVAFAAAGVEVVVLETGLGGRLDATNLVDPELVVITPIDFDHEAFLGSSIESIAAEKAGIIKSGRPAVFSEQRPAAFSVLERRALEMESPVTLSSSWRVEDRASRKIRQPLHARARRSNSDPLSAGRGASGGECPHRGRRAQRFRLVGIVDQRRNRTRVMARPARTHRDPSRHHSRWRA